MIDNKGTIYCVISNNFQEKKILNACRRNPKNYKEVVYKKMILLKFVFDLFYHPNLLDESIYCKLYAIQGVPKLPRDILKADSLANLKTIFP